MAEWNKVPITPSMLHYKTKKFQERLFALQDKHPSYRHLPAIRETFMSNYMNKEIKKTIMTQDTSTYYVWIGGSCDYGHKERAGGAAVVIENNGSIISRDVISDLHTTEFRMMLTLMVKVMHEIPEGSDILFLTNAAYIQNFDKTPTSKSANPDLIVQCICLLYTSPSPRD